MSKSLPFTGKMVVTSPFGMRQVNTQEGYVMKFHKGVDLVGQGDITVVSCVESKVTRITYQSGYGNYVWTETNDGFGIIYAHLKSVLCEVGDNLNIKDPIGIMGNTGNSTGPHLHMGVSTSTDYSTSHTKDSYWINPLAWLGVDNYNSDDIKGKTLNGSGLISVGSTVGITGTPEINKTLGTNGNYVDIIPSGEYYEVVDIKGTVSDIIYGRRYRVVVDLGNNEALDLSELRCKFSIKKTAFEEPNQSILTIYNLSPENENRIIQSGQAVYIEAGYNGSFYGKIYQGNIIQPLRSKENGVDYKLTLVSMDSERFTTWGLVSVSLTAKQTMRDAIVAATTKAKYPLETGSIADTRISYPRGKVMFGQSSKYLNQIAKSMNCSYYAEDGFVNIISPELLPPDEIFSLGPENGLIGSPTQTEIGISFECLLNPLISVNSFVRIDNKKIENYRYSPGTAIRDLDSQGIYRVITVTYVGDTRGEDWKCECEAIAQAGILPNMMGTKDLSIW